jgi:hypothetical protein
VALVVTIFKAKNMTFARFAMTLMLNVVLMESAQSKNVLTDVTLFIRRMAF